MGGRGVPLHPDAQQARVEATRIINRFRSHPVLPDHLLTFVQDIARDALVVAPQPVTEAWVKQTLAHLATLVRWVDSDGGAITREHVLSERCRARFISVGLDGYKDGSKNVYRTRLDLLTMALAGVTVRQPGTRPSLANSTPREPLLPEEEATLYAWACGLRPETRRKKVVAAVTLGLAVGGKTDELIAVRSDDVVIDERGVHVHLTNPDGEVRVVTARRAWEERVAALVEVTPPGHYLLSPWRDTSISPNTFTLGLWVAQEKFTPPTYFNLGRLRNTWVVRLMDAGVPLNTLLTAADLSSDKTITRLRPYCATQSTEAAAAAMRGGA